MSFVFPDKHFLRYDEVATIFRRSKRTVERWVQEKKLGYIVTPGGTKLIPRALVFGASANK